MQGAETPISPKTTNRKEMKNIIIFINKSKKCKTKEIHLRRKVEEAYEGQYDNRKAIAFKPDSDWQVKLPDENKEQRLNRAVYGQKGKRIGNYKDGHFQHERHFIETYDSKKS